MSQFVLQTSLEAPKTMVRHEHTILVDAATSVAHQEVPDPVRQGQPRHPIAAILMARFAVERTIQGQGLGRALLREAMLRDAMLRALSSTHELGTRAFVLDAKDDEAIRFYGKLRMMPARTTGTGFTGFSRT